MNLPLAILTVASVMQIPPPVGAPPGLHLPGPRVLMVSLPQLTPVDIIDMPNALDAEPELVFYFTDPADAEAVTAPSDSVESPVLLSDLPCPLHATLRSLGRWLLVLLSMVFVAALLGSVGAARRPLPLAAIAVRQPSRPVPLVERLLVLACLWSPMLMLLGLLQAEREMLSSVLLCMAATGAISSALMLASRRRLAARLRWAASVEDGGRMSTLPDGVVVRAEVEPKKLVAPPGDAGPTPWFRADLQVATGGVDSEAARISLEHVVVDDEAARMLVRMAMGLPVDPHGTARLTVLGCATRAPADAAGAAPLDRHAPTQARIAPSPHGHALIVAGTAEALARRLRSESILLTGAFAGSISAAVLTLFG